MIIAIEDIGIDNIYSIEMKHRSRLLNVLSKYDFIDLVGIYEDKSYVGIVSCLIDGISSDSAGSIFSENNISVRTGLQCAPMAHKFLGTFPAGTVRFSVGYFTNDDDINRLIDVLNFIRDNI